MEYDLEVRAVAFFVSAITLIAVALFAVARRTFARIRAGHRTAFALAAF